MSATFSDTLFALGVGAARARARELTMTCSACGTDLVRVEGGRACPACCASQRRCVFCGGAVDGPLAPDVATLGGPCCRGCAKPDEGA